MNPFPFQVMTLSAIHGGEGATTNHHDLLPVYSISNTLISADETNDYSQLKLILTMTLSNGICKMKFWN